MKLEWSKYCLDLDRKTCIMGILNTTPDSFSDGGRHADIAAAVEHGIRMAEDGADIIDIGGESTRPGSDPVPLDEELRRTIPVIEKLAEKIPVPISIDTYKSAVAEMAIKAGASMVNDISGLRFDPKMPETIARHKVPAVIMHIKGRPKDMQKDPEYTDLMEEIIDYFRISIRLAKKFGIPEEMLIIDPGIGFGKTFDHNLELINNLDKLSILKRPILVGPSRKAFLGRILDNAPASERLEGTSAACAVSIMKGANILRVHDVKEIAKVAKVVDAIKRERVV